MRNVPRKSVLFVPTSFRDEIAVFNCFNSGDHLIREEIPKDTDEDEESTCADQDEDIDELDPFSDFED